MRDTNDVLLSSVDSTIHRGIRDNNRFIQFMPVYSMLTDNKSKHLKAHNKSLVVKCLIKKIKLSINNNTAILKYHFYIETRYHAYWPLLVVSDVYPIVALRRKNELYIYLWHLNNFILWSLALKSVDRFSLVIKFQYIMINNAC